MSRNPKALLMVARDVLLGYYPRPDLAASLSILHVHRDRQEGRRGCSHPVLPIGPISMPFGFDISPTEVQHVAKELFGIRIRDENHRRCVVFEHGATMDIHGRTTLSGAAVEALDRIFGHMVGAAFRQNPRRMEEISMGATELQTNPRVDPLSGSQSNPPARSARGFIQP